MIRRFSFALAAFAAFLCGSACAAVGEDEIERLLKERLVMMKTTSSVALKSKTHAGACAFVVQFDKTPREREIASRRARALALNEMVKICAEKIPPLKLAVPEAEPGVRSEILRVRGISAEIEAGVRTIQGTKEGGCWAYVVAPQSKLRIVQNRLGLPGAGELKRMYAAELERLGDSAIADGKTKEAEQYFYFSLKERHTFSAPLYIKVARAAAANGKLAASRRILDWLLAEEEHLLTAAERKSAQSLHEIIDVKLPAPGEMLLVEESAPPATKESKSAETEYDAESSKKEKTDASEPQQALKGPVSDDTAVTPAPDMANVYAEGASADILSVSEGSKDQEKQ